MGSKLMWPRLVGTLYNALERLRGKGRSLLIGRREPITHTLFTQVHSIFQLESLYFLPWLVQGLDGALTVPCETTMNKITHSIQALGQNLRLATSWRLRVCELSFIGPQISGLLNILWLIMNESPLYRSNPPPLIMSNLKTMLIYTTHLLITCACW